MTSDNHVTGQDGFVPCPLCRQYSHSIGEDKLAEAFLVFQSMFSHRDDGIPTKWCFDEKARDAAQILMAAARQSTTTSEQASVHSPDEVERVALAIERADREKVPDGAADGFDHPEISDWGIHLARAAIAALSRTDDRLREVLADPSAVHVNMLRGGIAKPSHQQIWHLYGKELFDAMPEEYSAALQYPAKGIGE